MNFVPSVLDCGSAAICLHQWTNDYLIAWPNSGAAGVHLLNIQFMKQTGSLHTKGTADEVESETPMVMRITINCALRTLPSMVDRFARSHDRLERLVSIIVEPISLILGKMESYSLTIPLFHVYNDPNH
jgi:hypothetical protein